MLGAGDNEYSGAPDGAPNIASARLRPISRCPWLGPLRLVPCRAGRRPDLLDRAGAGQFAAFLQPPLQLRQDARRVLVLPDRVPVGGHIGVRGDRDSETPDRQHDLQIEERRHERAVGQGDAAQACEAVTANHPVERLGAARQLAAKQRDDAFVAGGHGSPGGKGGDLTREHERVVHQVNVADAGQGADVSVLAGRRAEQRRLGIGLLEILRDHGRLRYRLAVDLQQRDAADRMVLVELHRAVGRRLLDRDVGEALGVDLHPYSRRIGTDSPGMELHFKITSRIYSLRVTFLYSFRPTLALFWQSVLQITFLATSSSSTPLSSAAMFL